MATPSELRLVGGTAAPDSAAAAPAGGQLRVVITGHVDHGKSTLVGRLFHDTGMLPEGRMEAIEAMCRRRGMPFEWAFLMDSLKAERDQGITIDTSQIWFRHAGRDVVIIDAPGHREFIRNMVTGAALADAALLLIDADHGVRRQSRHHALLLHLLGVRQVAVLVNKMDLVGWDAGRFQAIEREARGFLAEVGIESVAWVPISAREGDNVAQRSANMPWYSGPTVLDLLTQFRPPQPATALPLRLPVQDVYKFDHRRIIAGRIESGRLAVGDRLLFSPSNRSARIASIEAWGRDDKVLEASAGQSVGFTLDDQIFVERGDVASHDDNPPFESDVFEARLFWLGSEPLKPGSRWTLRFNTRLIPATVERIRRTIDADALEAREASEVPRDAIADVVIRATGLVALDEHTHLARTGRFVLADRGITVAGGLAALGPYPDQRNLVTVRSTNVTAEAHRIDAARRAARNRHKPGVLWLTGLSGAGKSTLAMALEQRLFEEGWQVYVLDGDNVRRGLNANLGFSPEDRAENIRRVGEVAALMADAGMLVVTAFISPYRADRERARAAAKAAGIAFNEVWVKADMAVCEARDPKGLYARARKGEIGDFTGVSAPYEEPVTPELVVDTSAATVEACVRQIADFASKALGGHG
ncbi:MAG: adenylyl-sulfate kinase [Alphaproteobacteria bacterium]